MSPRRGLKTGILRAVSGILLGAVLFAAPGHLIAATLNDLLDEKQRLQQETNELKGEAKEEKAEINSLEGAIAFLDRSIGTLSGQIQSTETQIAETNSAIATKEQELADRKAQQDESIRVMYELEATNSVVESLLGNESLSEATNRMEYTDALEERVTEIMTAIEAVKSELAAKKVALDNLHAQQVDQRDQLEGRQAQKERLLVNSEVELAQINRQISANRSKIAAVEARIAAEVAALWRRRGFASGTGTRVAAGTPIGRLGSTGYSTGPHLHFECIRSGTPVNPRGCLPPLQWPLSDFYVSQEFGRPNWSAAYDWHTGIDLVASYGTPVRAACNGEIIMDQWYGGYGNAVVIDCGGGLWTLYGHMVK